MGRDQPTYKTTKLRLLSPFVRSRDGYNDCRILPAFGFLTTDEPTCFCITPDLNGRFTMFPPSLATTVLAKNDLSYGSFHFASFEFSLFGRVLDDSWSCHGNHLPRTVRTWLASTSSRAQRAINPQSCTAKTIASNKGL